MIILILLLISLVLIVGGAHISKSSPCFGDILGITGTVILLLLILSTGLEWAARIF